MWDLIIIGAGAVGSFLARSASAYSLKTLVIEKNLDVSDETTMANSAIAHSGYDPLPGTNKAKFNVLGNRMMPKICEELDVPFEKCGTLTLAFSEEEINTLKDLQERAKENEVEAKILSKEELFETEPNVSKEAIAGLLCKDGGIVNPFLLGIHALENALDNGVELKLGEKVLAINKTNEGWVIRTTKSEYPCKMVINAAGTHSDDIAKMVGNISWKIEPRKGEYYVLDHEKKGLVNHVLFTLPTKKGKGVLFTRTTSGNYLVGPSSEPVEDKDDLSTDPLTLSKIKESALKMVPNIPFKTSIRVYSGMRATPSTHDFILGPNNGDPTFINAAGIESPGLVSSPAIGEYLINTFVAPFLKAEKKENYKPSIKPYTNLKEMDPETRDAFIKEHPAYGHILCDCEQVSEGEMREVLSRKVPCLTMKAMKKRTRAGFGKCQGGFCGAKVLELLAEYEHKDLSEINYGKENSPFLYAKLKKGEE